MTFSDDDIEIIKELIADHGSDCPGLSCDRLRPLAERLGVWEPELPPTPEELARREKFKEAFSHYYKIVAEANKGLLASYLKDVMFAVGDDANGYQWPDTKIGSVLRIRLPNDYQVINKTGHHFDKKDDES